MQKMQRKAKLKNNERVKHSVGWKSQFCYCCNERCYCNSLHLFL